MTLYIIVYGTFVACKRAVDYTLHFDIKHYNIVFVQADSHKTTELEDEADCDYNL